MYTFFLNSPFLIENVDDIIMHFDAGHPWMLLLKLLVLILYLFLLYLGQQAKHQEYYERCLHTSI